MKALLLGAAGVLSFAPATMAAPAGDIAAGRAIFQQRCGMCHVVQSGQRGIAPNLADVVGRKAASSAFPGYSPALKASGLTWTATSLDRFLRGPQAMVPGSKMVVSLSDPQQRAAIIAYLATLGR